LEYLNEGSAGEGSGSVEKGLRLKCYTGKRHSGRSKDGSLIIVRNSGMELYEQYTTTTAVGKESYLWCNLHLYLLHCKIAEELYSSTDVLCFPKRDLAQYEPVCSRIVSSF
jgi:hypothetical protein